MRKNSSKFQDTWKSAKAWRSAKRRKSDKPRIELLKEAKFFWKRWNRAYFVHFCLSLMQLNLKLKESDEQRSNKKLKERISWDREISCDGHEDQHRAPDYEWIKNTLRVALPNLSIQHATRLITSPIHVAYNRSAAPQTVVLYRGLSKAANSKFVRCQDTPSRKAVETLRTLSKELWVESNHSTGYLTRITWIVTNEC